MNSNFEKVAKAATTINKAGSGMWGLMVAVQQDWNSLDHVALKETIKGQEAEANTQFKMKINENSTYRVIKGVVLSAVEYGISLVRPDGKPRGKTEVEADIKAAKGEKSAIEKFKSTIDTATKIEAKLETADLPLAAKLAKDVLDKLIKRIADLPSSGE